MTEYYNETRNHHKYLVVKAKGGMGNRMLCAITGIIYGQLTARKTIVDWRDESYSNDGSNAFPRFFLCSSVYPETVITNDTTVRPNIWNNKLNKSISNIIQTYDPKKHSSILIHRKYSVDVRKLEYEENILVFWYYTHRIGLLRRHLRDPNYGYAGLSTAQIIRKVLQEELKLQNDIRQRILDFKAKNWQQTVIGLHIRHTDLRTNLARYERPLRRFLERSPDAAIFLATDNQHVSEDYHRRFKKVFSTPKWFPDGMSTMHQNPICPDKVANGIESLVDMYLLAECDYLIYSSSSTFSWISRLLSNIPSENTADIERFNPKVRLKRLLREWVA